MIGRRQFLPALLVAAHALAGENVLIPAGEFTMGRTKLTRDDNTGMRPRVLLDDRPAHKVWLDEHGERPERERAPARRVVLVDVVARRFGAEVELARVGFVAEAHPLLQRVDAEAAWSTAR